MVYKVVFMRHGESEWNKANRFTGWTDVELTEQGKQEAQAGGQKLAELGYEFDMVFTSVLKRAIHTSWEVLKQIDQEYLPLSHDWRLNERHYGALQGLNKAETATKHGDEQVKIWRRSFDIRPPAMDMTDPRSAAKNVRYRNLKSEEIPMCESLKDTCERALPWWYNDACPLIKEGKRLLVAAHGNSIRALVKQFDHISDEDITELNIPTGVPLVYEFDENLDAVKHYYLMDETELKAKMEAVANQGKAK